MHHNSGRPSTTNEHLATNLLLDPVIARDTKREAADFQSPFRIALMNAA
jgi:hypothetical protein